MKVVKTIITATALIVVSSGAALAEDYRYEQVSKVCPSSGEAECYGTDAQDFIMGTLAVDVIFGKAGDDDIDTEGWKVPSIPTNAYVAALVMTGYGVVPTSRNSAVTKAMTCCGDTTAMTRSVVARLATPFTAVVATIK